MRISLQVKTAIWVGGADFRVVVADAGDASTR